MRGKEKELKNFINYIKDEDLKRDWEAFFQKDYDEEESIDWRKVFL